MAYPGEEAGKLSTEKDVWHISSDIPESISGVYKSDFSSHCLPPRTGFVLHLMTLVWILHRAGQLPGRSLTTFLIQQ
jgi:hypothetical protein